MPWSAQNHTVTSFLRNAIPVCHCVNTEFTDHNDYLRTYAMTLSVECDFQLITHQKQFVDLAPPRPTGPEFTALPELPNWIWGGNSGTGKARIWIGGREERGIREEIERRKNGSGLYCIVLYCIEGQGTRYPYRHFFFPLRALCLPVL